MDVCRRRNHARYVRIVHMKYAILAALVGTIMLSSCQPTSPESSHVTILDGENILSVERTLNTPSALLISAGVSFLPEDMVLVNGIPVSPDSPLPEGDVVIQIRPAVPVTFTKNGQQVNLTSSAPTVGQFLKNNGIQLRASDYLDPPAATPLLGPLLINIRQAKEFAVSTGGGSVTGFTSASAVGEALADAGISLQGMDYSIPSASEPLPEDGNIRVVRVNESVTLVQKTIPFNTEVQLTADLELDQQDLLQVGEPGLAATRTRIRYEDGQEIKQDTDAEAVVRPPKDRIIGAGTKIVFRTVDTPEGPLEYYRAVQVYATSYSPCRLGVPWCGYGTAGGLKAQKGVIGVLRSWWRYMNGDPVYVPGYGRAIISDIGAGIKGRYWIDLAYGDDNYVSWHSWTTMYFLTPVPPTIMYVLE